MDWKLVVDIYWVSREASQAHSQGFLSAKIPPILEGRNPGNEVGSQYDKKNRQKLTQETARRYKNSFAA